MNRLLLRDVEVDGARVDVLIVGGRIAAIAPDLAREDEEIDGRGGALIPGLTDHHIHLLATAAARDSIDLADCADIAAVSARIAAAARECPPGAWLRATACPAAIAERLDRDALNRIVPTHRLRVLDRTGALWVLNGAALAGIGDLTALERDVDGRATGRVWRGDAALRMAIGAIAPPLVPLGAELASFGITSVTDTSVTTDQASAALLADAIPQRLTLMSGGGLDAPVDGGFGVGAVKIVPDERDPLSLDDFVLRIAQARTWGRAVAVHCVTALELALTLAAFETAGTRPGDRIEHGGVIPVEAIAVIRELGLTVVTQPGFIAARGDAYRRDVDPREHPDLYRCASLINASVRVAGSSDAPYGPLDPWLAMRAAVTRKTMTGALLGAGECVTPRAALELYVGEISIEVGMIADLCLLRLNLDRALTELDARNVAATMIGGHLVWKSN